MMRDRTQIGAALTQAASRATELRSENTLVTRSRPFWKVLPRFPRESSTPDFLRSVLALAHPASSPATFEPLFPAALSFEYRQSGRECLYLLLSSLGLPRGARVGVQLYCCDAVFMAINAAGLIPVFLDIDLDTYSIDGASLHNNLNNLDALIVVHTFGYPADVSRVQSILSPRPIPIIEDCAHSLFSQHQDRATGSLTEASFFTFGFHKPAAAGGGGVAVANNDDVSKRMLFGATARRDSSAAPELSHAARRWLKGICYTRAAYGFLSAAIASESRELRVRRRLHTAAKQSSESPRLTHSLRRVDGCLIDSRLNAFAESLPLLERNARALRTALLETPLHIPEEPDHGAWNHFMLPVRFASAMRRDRGRVYLRKLGVDTAPLYRNCVQNASFYGYRGGCPNAEFAAQTVCTVPNHRWMTEEDLVHLCSALRSSVYAS